MVEWTSAEVRALTAFAFAQATVFMLGVYLWYFVLSFKDVEWPLLRRRLRAQLAHVPYLVGRYAHLMAAVGIAVSTHVRPQPDRCASLALSRFLAVTEDVALAAASSNLALRAMVLWRDVRPVDCALRAVCVVHVLYGLILGIAAVSAQVDPRTHACAVESTPGPLLAFFIFTLVWDVAIMALTLWGMRRKALIGGGTPRLAAVVAAQGVGYAVVTTLTCVPMAVMYILQLNEVMDIFLIPVGCTFSVIASSAAVTSLFKIKDLEDDSHVRAPSQPATFNNSKAPNEFSTVIDLRSAVGASTTTDLHAVAEDAPDDGASTLGEDSSVRPLTRGLRGGGALGLGLGLSAASLAARSDASDVELGLALHVPS